VQFNWCSQLIVFWVVQNHFWQNILQVVSKWSWQFKRHSKSHQIQTIWKLWIGSNYRELCTYRSITLMHNNSGEYSIESTIQSCQCIRIQTTNNKHQGGLQPRTGWILRVIITLPWRTMWFSGKIVWWGIDRFKAAFESTLHHHGWNRSRVSWWRKYLSIEGVFIKRRLSFF